MLNACDISEALTSAIIFVAKNQNTSGGFTSVSQHSNEENKNSNHETIFYPALIATLLKQINQPQINDIVEKIYFFLVKEKNNDWSFNYWSKRDPIFGSEPYPNDLDDTCLALAAFANYRSQSISGKGLAHLISFLINNETTPGGPYFTWLINIPRQGPWNDVDCAVNTSIAYCLDLQGIRLPNLDNYFQEVLESETYQSPYYCSRLSVLYLMSRVVDKKLYKTLSNAIKVELKAPVATLLDKALSAAALIRLGNSQSDVENLIEAIITAYGNYEADEMIIEKKSINTAITSGCSALTAAACAQALYYFQQSFTPTQTNLLNPESEEDEIHNKVIKNVAKRFAAVGKNIQKIGLEQLARIISQPISREITLVSYHTAQSLGSDLDINEQINLGTANLFGWLAYDIYDTCYDTSNVTSALTVANFCLREATTNYYAIAERHTLNWSLITAIFDEVDQSYALEFETSKIHSLICGELKRQITDQTENPTGRSIGHALGPLIIFQINKQTKINYQTYKSFFGNYLAAKQLSDDLHDWRDDLKNGLLTQVTRPILAELCSHHKATELFNHKTHEHELEEIFWNTVCPNMLTIARGNIQQARSEISALPWKHEPRFFVQLLSQLDQAFDSCLHTYQTAREFISNYNQVDYASH